MADDSNHTPDIKSHNFYDDSREQVPHPRRIRSQSREYNQHGNKEDSDYGPRSFREREVCRNFLNNRCNLGLKCKYEHRNDLKRGEASNHRARDRSRSPHSAPNISKADVCNDFMRNMCQRGNQCRYYHPEKPKNKMSWFTICLDYQNKQCKRKYCRYFHVTDDDENQFKIHGEIAAHTLQKALNTSYSLEQGMTNSETRPVCKNYLKGSCSMETCCYRHLSWNEYEFEVYDALYNEFEKLFGTPASKSSPNTVLRKISMAKKSHSGLYSQRDDQMDNYSGFQDDRNFTSDNQKYYSSFDTESDNHRRYSFDNRDRPGHDFNRQRNERSRYDDRMTAHNSPYTMSKQQLEDAFVDLKARTYDLQRQLLNRPTDNWESDLRMQLNASETENQCLQDTLVNTNETLEKIRNENARLNVRLENMQDEVKNVMGLKASNSFLFNQMKKICLEMQRLESEVSSQWATMSPTLSGQPTWTILKTLVTDVFSKLPENMFGNYHAGNHPTL